ncbi:metallophosphoesterase family protein [Photobacterium kishitanii]|uniref:Calcineurin-like phosphoesterase domain-containing protein n=1 Tax=Photobacterium kishitanii TaxID=318456 RepID=A0A2T3KME8_9GAMM|nr:metallophosphoesterase [Photobacterium kishitanii]PSV00958.1 hypothetical protein C9J27_02730 [Photobacterium kishitanii]
MKSSKQLAEIIDKINKKEGNLLFGLLSDVHLEEFNFYVSQKWRSHKKDPSIYESILKISPPSEKLDVLLIAGDFCEARLIDTYRKTMEEISAYAFLVIVIDGNHESWGINYQRTAPKIKEAIQNIDNVIFLQNNEITIKDINIFGSCLWTDFGFNNYIIYTISETYPQYVKDKNLQKIKWNNSKVKGHHIQTLSIKAKKAIEKWLDRETENKRLLLSHYPPFRDKVIYDDNGGETPESIAKDLMNIDYTDLSEKLSQNQDVVVVHGHLHAVSSYKSKTGNNVYCNPRGMFHDKNETESYRILEFRL